jgi:hypothetical protein
LLETSEDADSESDSDGSELDDEVDEDPESDQVVARTTGAKSPSRKEKDERQKKLELEVGAGLSLEDYEVLAEDVDSQTGAVVGGPRKLASVSVSGSSM